MPLLQVGAPARVGLVAPVDVTVPAGNTGLDPSQTNFFQVSSADIVWNIHTPDWLPCAAAPDLVASSLVACVVWRHGVSALTTHCHSAKLRAFMQALNIPTKINKGTVEITTDVQLIRIGEKVRPCLHMC